MCAAGASAIRIGMYVRRSLRAETSPSGGECQPPPDQATTEYYKRSLRRPPRSGEQEVNLGGTQIKFFTYRPVSCVTPGLLLVFHGLNRNADGYRDYAQPIADKRRIIVVAALFEKYTGPRPVTHLYWLAAQC
jgi:poly(3-hydroxybutyrate) depolymerase